jgi:hypothetical protein
MLARYGVEKPEAFRHLPPLWRFLMVLMVVVMIVHFIVFSYVFGFF